MQAFLHFLSFPFSHVHPSNKKHSRQKGRLVEPKKECIGSGEMLLGMLKPFARSYAIVRPFARYRPPISLSFLCSFSRPR